jgi:hypothetical protein
MAEIVFAIPDLIRFIGAHLLEGFFPVAGFMEAKRESDICNPIILRGLPLSPPSLRYFDFNDEPRSVWKKQCYHGSLDYVAIRRLHENHLRVLRSRIHHHCATPQVHVVAKTLTLTFNK